jgi:hypothetical protein
MQDFYRPRDTRRVPLGWLTEPATKLVKDMHYEARVQAVIQYTMLSSRKGRSTKKRQET